MVIRICEYVLELKDSYLFIYDWCTLPTALELAYKTSIHSGNNQNPAILERGWNPRLPQVSSRKDLAEVNPIVASFKVMLEKSRKNAVKCMEGSFAYSKDK
ncbi:hypothetical protein O181_060558 [Austropuccinia psidii MF-1]|uniref:Uncharacterized protein n=1 Tax=Austropuccinia psidii MF-1 TaxID=1389203 RepID=A0A9Q3EL09_9BASI|nr:hypothetical protein [Austropuccinia psidii MF-1]